MKLQEERQKLIDTIKAVVAPHLHSSSYVGVRMTYFNRARKIRSISSGLEDGIQGFTQKAIVLAGWGGGLMTINYSQVCIEDLIKIKELVENIPYKLWK